MVSQVIGQQQSPLEILVIKDGKELKLGMDINVNIKWVHIGLHNYILLVVCKFVPFQFSQIKFLLWAKLHTFSLRVDILAALVFNHIGI